MALSLAELMPMASPSARTEKRAVLGVVLASSESKERVRRLALTEAPVAFPFLIFLLIRCLGFSLVLLSVKP